MKRKAKRIYSLDSDSGFPVWKGLVVVPTDNSDENGNLCSGVGGFLLYSRQEWEQALPADFSADEEGYIDTWFDSPLKGEKVPAAVRRIAARCR